MEAGVQDVSAQNPRVEAERVPRLRAEEPLRDLQRVERQRAGALRVRPGLLEDHVLPARVQSPRAAALKARAEHPRRCGRVQRVREPERGGPDGLVPGAAAAARILPDQSLDGEALLDAAGREHAALEEEEEEVKRRSHAVPVPGAQSPGSPITRGSSRA